MTMVEKFWMVVRLENTYSNKFDSPPPRAGPRFRHKTRKDAENEADRLALESDNGVYVVLEAVDAVGCSHGTIKVREPIPF